MRWLAPRLIGLRPLPVLPWIRRAVRQPADVRLPLLRPHCHSRLPQRPVAARAGGALLPSGARRSGVSKEVLSQRTAATRTGSDALPHHHTPIVWAEKGVRRKTMSGDGYVEWQRTTPTASLSSSESMEQGSTSAQPAEIPDQGPALPRSRPPAPAASRTTTSTSAMKFSAPS